MNVRGVLVTLIIRLQGLASRYTHTEWLQKQTLGEEETAAYLRARSRSFSRDGQRDSYALFLEILLTELSSVSQWLPDDHNRLLQGFLCVCSFYVFLLCPKGFVLNLFYTHSPRYIS